MHITRRSFIKGAGLVALGAGLGLSGCAPSSGTGAGSGSSANGQTTPLLAIIHTNDTHGHDAEVAATDNEQGNFSMAAVPALRAEWEAKGYEVLVVDVGDATQGMPLVDQSSGEAGYQNAGTDPIGAFPQVAGIELSIDTSVPYEKGEQYPDSTFCGPANPGARVKIASVGGKPFSTDEAYSIATSDFLCQGGDTYHAFKEAAEAEAPVTCDFDYEAFTGYLTVACDHEVPDAYAQPQGRIAIA